MLDSVIVTVRVENTDIEYDMELPADIQGSELCKKLLEALRVIETETFKTVGEIGIFIEKSGQLLSGEQTLEEAKVWDGSIIVVKNKCQN